MRTSGPDELNPTQNSPSEAVGSGRAGVCGRIVSVRDLRLVLLLSYVDVHFTGCLENLLLCFLSRTFLLNSSLMSEQILELLVRWLCFFLVLVFIKVQIMMTPALPGSCWILAMSLYRSVTTVQIRHSSKGHTCGQQSRWCSDLVTPRLSLI